MKHVVSKQIVAGDQEKIVQDCVLLCPDGTADALPGGGNCEHASARLVFSAR